MFQQFQHKKNKQGPQLKGNRKYVMIQTELKSTNYFEKKILVCYGIAKLGHSFN